MNRLHGKATAIWGFLFMVFFVSAWFLSGRSYPTLDIDHSWQAILEYAAEHSFRFGRDIIFTYGPLGYLNTEVSQGHLLLQRIAFSLAWSGCVAASVVFLARRLALLPRLLFIAWFLLFSWLGMLEQHLYLLLACCSIHLMDDTDRPAWHELPVVLAMAGISLVKFTFFLAAAIPLLGITAARLARREYSRGLGLCGSAITLLALCWLLAGQKLADLLPWIKASLQITSGYSGAMGLVASPGALASGLVTLALFGLAILALAAKREPDYGLLLFGLISACYAFLTWKHGFVRAYGHVQIFFQTMPLLFASLVAVAGEGPLSLNRRKMVQGAFLLSLAVCLAGIQLHQPGSIAARIKAAPAEFGSHLAQLGGVLTGSARRHYQALGDRHQELLAPALLPTIRSTVGRESVDVLNVSLWAAPANGMNYTPRPVIQGYSVYTPWLQEKNLEFFRSPAAPAYLLMDMLTIDNRFPALDDAPALLHILGNYAPVAREGQFLLLKKRSNQPVRPQPVHEQQLRFGETMDLGRWNSGYLVAEITTRPTLAGRLADILFQTPPLWLEIDSAAAGSRYRVAPATGTGRFLLSPAVASARDLAELYDNRLQTKVTSLRLALPPWGRSLLHDSYSIRLYQLQ